MKKTIIPSKGLFALSIVAFLFPACLLWGCIEERFFYPVLLEIFLDAIRTPSVFYIVMAVLTIVMCIVFVIGSAVYTYGLLELFLFAGRPVKFSEDTISLGYIKKKHYYKKDITGIGIAPWLVGYKGNGIYITFGDYDKSFFSKIGIMPVWDVVEFHKVLPKVVEFLHKVGAKISHTDDTINIQRSDGLLWMTYTEENMRFLQNWLGSKFYEITQQEEL